VAEPRTRSKDFDASGLDSLLSSIGEDGAAEVVDAMVDDLPRIRTDVSAAIKTRDLGVLRRNAHSLKGNSRMVGADALADEFATLEAGSADGEAETRSAHWSQLLVRYKALATAAQRHLAELGS
jgi:HPt (histidine-containing phosphotransfer) domain-containing protein